MYEGSKPYHVEYGMKDRSVHEENDSMFQEAIGYDEWMPRGLKKGSAACRWKQWKQSERGFIRSDNE